MSELESARYVPAGVAAITPAALGVAHPIAAVRPNRAYGCVTCVNIDGPLVHESRAACGFDNYSSIAERFDAALRTGPTAIVLNIASPGGDVAGAFDLARDMRRKAAKVNVKLVAFSDSECCSAAYAIACAAPLIVCSDTAMIGSIGVIVQPVDTTGADRMMGLKYETISSGDRKEDGNPHVTLSDGARSAIAKSVDVMAAAFFEHVGSSRPWLNAKGAENLQAGVRVGVDAESAGLVDSVTSFSSLIEALGGTPDSSHTDLSDQQASAFGARTSAPQSKSNYSMSFNAPVAIDLATKFQALTSAGVSPDLAREQVALDAEAMAAQFRSQIAAKPAALKAVTPPVAAPVAVAPVVATPRTVAAKPGLAEAMTAHAIAQVAALNAHTANGGDPATWQPQPFTYGPQFAHLAPRSAQSEAAELAAIEARLGIAHATAAVSFDPRIGIQSFGGTTSVASQSKDAASRELDSAFGLLENGGVVMQGDSQVFGALVSKVSSK